MNTQPVRWKMIAWIAVVAVVVIIVIFTLAIHDSSHPSTTAQNPSAASTTVTTVSNLAPNGSSTASAVPPPSKKPSANNIPDLPGPAITIHLITPISGNVWTIGGQNPIAWDNPANITGEIELVNATTKAFVGVILSETGPKQISYSWNARSIYLGRYSANEVDVVPGTYSIVIHFDGNGLGDLVSGPITITN